MAIPKHLEPFFALLEKATAENRVPWEEGASDVEFLASMSNSSLRLFRSYDPDERVAGVFLNVLNSQGKVVDRIALYEGDPAYSRLDDLYDAALRKARNADEVVKDLMGELSADELPPSADGIPF